MIREEEMKAFRSQIDFKMFSNYDHEFQEKISKKAGDKLYFFFHIFVTIHTFLSHEMLHTVCS